MSPSLKQKQQIDTNTNAIHHAEEKNQGVLGLGVGHWG